MAKPISEDEHESFSAEQMETMKLVGTCTICQGMHSAGGEVCDECKAMPNGTMAVFQAHAVEVSDSDGNKVVLQGLGIALVSDLGNFPFVDGAIYRVIVQGET